MACSSGLGVANLPHQIVQTPGACVRRTVPKHGDNVGGDDELAIRKCRRSPPIDGRWDQVVEAAAGTNGNLAAACQRNKAPASKGFGHLTAHHVYSIAAVKIKVIAENSEAAFSVLHDAAPAIAAAITAASTIAATAAITTPAISATAITATISTTTVASSITTVATASISARVTASIATGIASIAGSIATIHPAWLGICVGVGGSSIGVGLGSSIGSILSVGKTTKVSVAPAFA